MTCTCQKLQGVIYRRKDGSFYLKNDTCPEHGGIQGTKTAYIIFDEATGTELGSAAAPTLAICPDCHFMLPHTATSSCLRNMNKKVDTRMQMPLCEACELEKKYGGQYVNHSCARRVVATPPEHPRCPRDYEGTSFLVTDKDGMFYVSCGVCKKFLGVWDGRFGHRLQNTSEVSAAPPSEREAFEKSIYFVGFDFARDDKGDYTDPDTYHAYLGYIARAARVVASQPLKLSPEPKAARPRELVDYIVSVTGPTGGWLVSPKDVQDKITAIDTPAALRDLREKIHEALRSYRCQFNLDDTQSGLGLEDVLSADFGEPSDISTGINELVLLADHIAAELANPAPAAAPLERSAKYFFHETPWMCDNSVGPIWPLEANNQVFKFAEEFKVWAVDEAEAAVSEPQVSPEQTLRAPCGCPIVRISNTETKVLHLITCMAQRLPVRTEN